MVTTDHSRIFANGEATTLFVTIPAAVVNDSQFPFDPDDPVSVTIDEDGLRITSQQPEAGAE